MAWIRKTLMWRCFTDEDNIITSVGGHEVLDTAYVDMPNGERQFYFGCSEKKSAFTNGNFYRSSIYQIKQMAVHTFWQVFDFCLLYPAVELPVVSAYRGLSILEFFCFFYSFAFR